MSVTQRDQRPMGNGGPMVGAIGLGCMSFAGFYGGTDREESLATLQRAVDLGVTHFDTAIVYGMGLSESIVGEFFEGGKHNVHIATKCGIVVKPTRSFNNKRDYVREAVQGSLERLRTDKIDLFYLHRRDQEVAIEDAMETMAELVSEGIIGSIGLSEVAPYTLERASKVHHVAAVQNEYSLWTRQPDLGLVQACERLGTALVAFSPLGRGMFGDIPIKRESFGELDFRAGSPRFSEEHLATNEAKFAPFRAWCKEKGWATSAVAVAWGLARSPGVISIPGTRSSAHLDQLMTADAISLSAADMAEIDAILPPGWAHGHRYSDAQDVGPERYC